jgi:hypothetical protein
MCAEITEDELARHIALTGEIRNTYKISDRNTARKRTWKT